MEKITQKLTNAFKELRRKDYFCKKALACCRSCALFEIPEKNDCLYVFTTDQDENDLKRTGKCYLAWSAPEDSAKEIIKELREVGLKVSHNGSPRTRIKISLK